LIFSFISTPHWNIVSPVVKYLHSDDGIKRGRQPLVAEVADGNRGRRPRGCTVVSPVAVPALPSVALSYNVLLAEGVTSSHVITPVSGSGCFGASSLSSS